MNRQRGFTLVEIIAAFALMAIALTVCLSISSRAYRQVARADESARATAWAQSLMADMEAKPLVVGQQSGKTADGVFRWQREVSPYQDPEGVVVAKPGAPGLLRVTLTLRWGDGGRGESVVLDGLRAPSPTALPEAAP